MRDSGRRHQFPTVLRLSVQQPQPTPFQSVDLSQVNSVTIDQLRRSIALEESKGAKSFSQSVSFARKVVVVHAKGISGPNSNVRKR